MSQPRYLTKSRFKLATECPTKLFYTGKKEYLDNKLDDPFLASLADGGFQVGELAKCYYPDGHDITSLDYEESVRQTNELLTQKNVVIFEPAIRFGHLFVRIDILVKKGNEYQLIEVKAKSYSAKKDKDFLNKSGKLDAKWKPYIFDVAFQKYVLKQAIPDAIVSSYLMVVDKDTPCPVDGLNQKFKLTRDNRNRRGVSVSNSLTDSDLAIKILKKVNTDNAVQIAYETELQTAMPAKNFIENIKTLANKYANDEKVMPVIGSKCKGCEFKCSPTDEANGFKSGFKECWKEQLHWKDEDFKEPTVLNLANFRGANRCIENGKVKLKDIEQEDINYEESSTPALSLKERQWMQVEKVKDCDSSVYFDVESIRNEMATWVYPLHFIDFETCAVAIPFYKGMSPYEGIAFQFSHHILHDDGRVEHAGQFLCSQVGEFPNFNFVRELKSQLEKDNGTIFRYSNHENAYLNMVYQQLKSSSELDTNELCEFIKSITKSSNNSKDNWLGHRNMVDQWELVKKYYYDPATSGSNSIKAVLPAILNSSQFLQKKYAKPIYGTEELPSLNFQNKSWIEFDAEGKVNDPYKSLPRMFSDASMHDIELLSESDELNNGGLALTAYARLQFTEMSDYERKELERGLLMYCELDTLAMVMIQEAWQEMLR
ncbi:DUF2779 domain-containing protein [Thalassotalea profundi]|uniref:DUF2779 domain-containing protein n=1 Tax=Thalassotalea profundi TaxID=2036687 RepID=A0ABQ3J797_9GAMM|nr:DUF2779 domain-containing protein [Thalassotalea profundi]GHF02668.1 hypothetical protein GCM10011501_35030 [Thalassotalea profundi]